MRITRDFVTGLPYYVILMQVVSSMNTFIAVETPMKKQRLKRPTPNSKIGDLFKFNREAYPVPLPTQPVSYVLSPYRTIYQGVRNKNDTRVFRRRFAYEPMLRGHHVVTEGLFDCLISHIAIETTEAIPVLLRGGAGYRYFTAVIKAKPGHELKGQVRAYCRHRPPDFQGEQKRRKYDFGQEAADDDYSNASS